MRDAQLKLVREGRHKGWNSRNIKSYPEIFWEKVLTNNGIDFEREVPALRYFLDFVLRKNGVVIDIEIDGKIKIKTKNMSPEERDKMSLVKTESKAPEDVQLILG